MYYFKEICNYELFTGLMEGNKDLNQKVVTDSHKREDLIVQILKENLDLDVNHDSNFVNVRELRYIQFKLYEREGKKEKEKKEEEKKEEEKKEEEKKEEEKKEEEKKEEKKIEKEEEKKEEKKIEKEEEKNEKKKKKRRKKRRKGRYNKRIQRNI